MLRLVEEHGTRYWALIGNDLHFPSLLFIKSLSIFYEYENDDDDMIILPCCYRCEVEWSYRQTGIYIYDWLIVCTVVHNIMHCLKLHINIHIEQSRFETVLLWIFFTFTTTSYYFLLSAIALLFSYSAVSDGIIS